MSERLAEALGKLRSARVKKHGDRWTVKAHCHQGGVDVKTYSRCPTRAAEALVRLENADGVIGAERRLISSWLRRRVKELIDSGHTDAAREVDLLAAGISVGSHVDDVSF